MPDPALAPAVRDLLDPLPTTPQAPAPPRLGRAAAIAFGALARLRGRRPLHPDGVVLAATLRVPALADRDAPQPAAWHALDGEPAVVRLSRSVGLPDRFPDVLGLAVRVGAQDLLLSTAGRGLGAQHVLLPARRFIGPAFSSIAPYRVGGRVLLVTATLRAPGPHRGAPTLGDLARLVPGLTVHLRLTSLRGRSWPLGVLHTGAVLVAPEASGVRFDPWRAGGGLVPAGLPQDVRAPAYAASRRAAPSRQGRP